MLKLCSINQPLCSNLTFSFSLTYKILIFINVTILSSSSMVYNLQYTRTIYIVVDLSSENKGNFPKSCIYKHDCVTLENYETEVIDGNLAYYVSIMLDAFSCLFCPKLCWHYRHKPNYEEHLNSCRWWVYLFCEIGLHCILCMGECCFELFSLQVAGMSTIQSY